MTLVVGPVLPLAALVVPLLLALVTAVPAVRPRAVRLLPLAPLPALWLALQGPRDRQTEAPDLLFGVVLGLDANGALLLGVTAALWLAAGVYALGYLRDTHRPGILSAFWCVTLAGNLGVFLARDVVTFYVAFSAVTLAAWVLVVHEGSVRALSAGRVYIILAFAGETALLMGLLLATDAAGSFVVADVRAALAAGFEGRGAALALLIAGFGLKAGMVPLHMWLPLAHPVAPTPASAVLSGAIVKAGIFGLLAFLPATGAADWGAALVWIGIAGAWGGILLGLTQREPKAVLAYSTVSQMGLVIAVLATAMTGEGADPLAAFYAAHHGLAKGALFLAVGVIATAGGRLRLPALAMTGLVAGSIAGLPLTGGAVAKLAIKAPFGEGAAAAAVSWSGLGTALVLLHFLVRAARESHASPHAAPPVALALPWLAAGGLALVLPWVLAPAYAGFDAAYVLKPQNLWSGVPPLTVAALLALAAWRTGLALPVWPPGDLAILVRRAAGRAAWPFAVRSGPAASGGGAGRALSARLAAPFRAVAGLERNLQAWSVAGLLLALLALFL